MSKSVLKLLAATALVGAGLPASAQTLGLGRAALPAEIAAWDVSVQPNGHGLPVGSGDVLTGEDLWVENCAMCHGDFGEGAGAYPVIAGGDGTLTNRRPVKTVGSYWPYLSTVFDYVHRSMPFGNAQILTPDDTYAIVAYILYSNGLVEDDFTLSNENFTDVVMPNAEGFYPDDRDESEVPLFTHEVCMTGCGPAVHITHRATDLQSTPEGAVTVFAPDRPTGVADNAGAPEGGEGAAPAAPAPAPAEPVEQAVAEPESPGLDPALVAAGEGLWRQCRSCHQVGDGARNGTGPLLTGVVGRHAASVEGFRYSAPMQEAGANGLIWTPEELDSFLADPRAYMRGTRMSFRGLRDAGDRQAIIAYLQSQSQ
ncbi:MAG: c-type cytochrome [Rhodobacter sp.]|uniref:c-type cytochrome n=1 Tax=Pararhodobacter sp. TaxID=2127056 RepID=UPI002BFDFC55|nr:c-type cytochrome [Pararhodobacter sp.]MCC0074264.1 c-type cytochrome [Rhodobacter sp.]HPD93508.1 c-type cytochrome [Pararhodobacter sp.]